MQQITLVSIGWVRSSVREIKEDYWGDTTSTIELDGARFSPAALSGLADFSHVEVLFYMDRVPAEKIVTDARHPRGNQDWPVVGIFAQRAKARPNHIGATICRLLEVSGNTIKVGGLDALDGTPVLDLKPVFREFLPEPGTVRQPAWSHEMMSKYFAVKH